MTVKWYSWIYKLKNGNQFFILEKKKRKWDLKKIN